ncbi:hypothetical protein ABPG72_015586 [Tetrahymena utriculariae]
MQLNISYNQRQVQDLTKISLSNCQQDQKIGTTFSQNRRRTHQNYQKILEKYIIKRDRQINQDISLTVNGQDITDKIKYSTITFDEPLENKYVNIPRDLYFLIMRDPKFYNLINNNFIPNCLNCQCQKMKMLSSIKVVSQEYVFEITPNMYTNYQLREDKKKYCLIRLIGVDYIVLLIFHTSYIKIKDPNNLLKSYKQFKVYWIKYSNAFESLFSHTCNILFQWSYSYQSNNFYCSFLQNIQICYNRILQGYQIYQNGVIDSKAQKTISNTYQH